LSKFLELDLESTTNVEILEENLDWSNYLSLSFEICEVSNDNK